jgi:hypothetical protein
MSSWKRWRRRKTPSMHKHDSVSYEWLRLFEVPKPFWYDKSWKDTTKRKHQYKNIVEM